MASDTARFVITGVFDPTQMMRGIDAALSQMEAKLGGRVAALGKSISNSTSAAMSKTAGDATKQANKNLGEAANKAREVAKGVNGANAGVKEFNSDIFTAIRRVVLWGAASRLVFNTIQGIGDALKNTIALNKTLVDIQKIRGPSFDIAPIRANILSSAEQFGVAFKEIAETQRLFFQQGFDTAQVITLTNSQLLAVTASGLSAQESIELMIGSMSVFNISAERSITLIDKLQNVQANYAVSTQDIAVALRRVGPVVEQFGGDIDHVIGIITSLKESTRKSGEFIGTALSTIFSRIFTGVGTNQLKIIGIDINKTATEFKPLSQILDEVAIKWKNLSKQEKISIAFALGARRRYAQVISLMDNYDTALSAAASASNSFGAALEAQQIEITSTSRQFEIFKTKITNAGLAIIAAFSHTTDANEGLANFAKNLQHTADFIKKYASSIATAIKVTGFFATVLVNFFILKKIWPLIAGVTVALRVFTVAAWELFGVFTTSSLTSLFAFGAALSHIEKLLVANLSPILLTVGAVILGVISYFGIFKKATEDATPPVKDLSHVYKGFANAGKDVIDMLNRYYAVSKQFKDLGGVSAIGKYLGPKVFTEGKFAANSLLGILTNLKGVSKDLSNITYDQIVAALEKMEGGFTTAEEKAKAVKDSVQGMSDIIGFINTTRLGAGQELDTYRAQLEKVGLAFVKINSELDAANIADNAYDIGDAFTTLSGLDLGGVLNGIISNLPKEIVTLNQIGPALNKAVQDELDKLTFDPDTAFGALFDPKQISDPEIKAQINEFMTRLLSNFIVANHELAASMQSPRYAGGIKYKLNATPNLVVDPNVIKGQVSDMYGKITDINNVQAKVSDIVLQSNILPNYLQSDASKEALETYAERMRAINKTFDESDPKTKAFIEQIKNIIKVATAGGDGIGDLPKKITSGYSGLAKLASGVKLVELSFNRALESAAIFGKDLSSTVLSKLQGRIKESSEIISNASLENYDAQIKSNSKLLGIYRDRLQKINKSSELTDKEALTVQDLTKKITGLVEANANLYNEKKYNQELIDKERKKNEELISIYTKYKERLRSINNEYTLTINSITGVREENAKLIQQYGQYSKKVLGVVTANRELLAGSDIFKKYSVSIDSATESFKLQKRAVEDQRNNIIATYKAQVSALGVNRDNLNALLDMVVASGELPKFSKELSDNQKKQLDTLSQQLNKELESNTYEKQRIIIGEEREKQLIKLNTLLEYNKQAQSDINSLATNYADALVGILNNIGAIVTENGGLVKLLTPIADAWKSFLSDKLKTYLSDSLRGFSEKSLGTATFEISVDEAKQLNTYDIGGGILESHIISGIQRGASAYLANPLVQGTPEKNDAGVFYNFSPSPTATDKKFIEGVTGTNKGINRLNDIQIIGQQYDIEGNLLSARQLAKTQASNALLYGMSSMLGQVLGAAAGGNSAEAARNAGLGSSFGQLAGLAIFKANPIAGVAGALLGGIVGGLFGGGHKSAPKQVEPKIYEANTDALRSNTEAITRNSQKFDLLAKLINAPADFVTPSPALIGGGLPVIVVTSNQGDPEKAAYDGISKAYNGDYRRIGRRG